MSLPRAHVSVGIGVSLEDVPRGNGLGGEELARVQYRWPAITALEERELCDAYESLTGRRVWPKMLPLLRVCHRSHGPDTIALMGELFEEVGVQDLLVRLRSHPPRTDQVADAQAAKLTLVKPDPSGLPRPRVQPKLEPKRIASSERRPNREIGESVRKRQEPPRYSAGLTSVANIMGRESDVTTAAPGLDGPASSQVRRSRPAGCVSDHHEPTWHQLPDGTRNCRTCHP